jgi:hypothetical protein
MTRIASGRTTSTAMTFRASVAHHGQRQPMTKGEMTGDALSVSPKTTASGPTSKWLRDSGQFTAT